MCIVHVRSHDGQNRARSVVCATKCYACHASASRMSPTATQVRSEYHQELCLTQCCVRQRVSHSVCVTMLCGTELCACVSQFGVSQRSSGGGGGGGADGVQRPKTRSPHNVGSYIIIYITIILTINHYLMLIKRQNKHNSQSPVTSTMPSTRTWQHW